MTIEKVQFQLAAIVLCGGQSSRMGIDKFMLPLGDRTFLEAVVEKLALSVDGPIIAVASTQTIDAVDEIRSRIRLNRFVVVQDQRENSGPLEGIRVGLNHAGRSSKWAFVTSCDAPLISPTVPEFLVSAIKSIDDSKIEAAIPITSDRVYGMTAVYRCDTAAKISAMVERNQLRVSDLAKELNTTEVTLDAIRELDPDLDSIKNLNSADDYLEFLDRRGLECSPEIKAKLLTNGSNTTSDD